MCREHSSFCLKTLSGCAESLLLHLGFLCVWQAGLLFPAGHIFLTLGSALPCGARLSIGAALPCWAWPSHCAGCSSLRIMTFSLWGLPFPVGHDLLCEGCSSLRVMTFSLWGLPFPVGHDLLCGGCSSLWGMAFSLWGLLLLQNLVPGCMHFRSCFALWLVGSSQTRACTCVPYIGRQILNHSTTRESLYFFTVL